jgi:hypothetical protein
MESCTDSLLPKVEMKSLNAETYSAQRKIRKGKRLRLPTKAG